jgi:hypothetical protein
MAQEPGHEEDGLFRTAHMLKKELNHGVLPPSQDRVFTDCRMIIVVSGNPK